MFIALRRYPAISGIVLLCARQSWSSTSDRFVRRFARLCQDSVKMRSGSANAKSLRNAALMMVKPTALTPMPRASAPTATAEYQRSLTIRRHAKRVLPQTLDGRQRAFVAMLLLQHADVADTRDRRTSSLLMTHAVPNVVHSEHLDVEPQFLVELVIEQCRSEVRNQASPGASEPTDHWITLARA
jgi:hypothetical protein